MAKLTPICGDLVRLVSAWHGTGEFIVTQLTHRNTMAEIASATQSLLVPVYELSVVETNWVGRLVEVIRTAVTLAEDTARFHAFQAVKIAAHDLATELHGCCECSDCEAEQMAVAL